MPAASPDLFQVIAGEAHVALAVSGGSDSMALLRLAHDRSGPRLSVLTVDHGLRAGSASESDQVARWAKALGLTHHTLQWTGPKPATGIQAKARQARYDLMTRWCKDNGATALLTAHTMDDQAETVLMRMARTSSLDSLAGIAPIGQWDGVRLVRPLLQERRESLRDYLRSSGQAWLDDPSNEDHRFERVRIRATLQGLGESGVTAEGLAGLADECRTAVEAMQDIAEDFVSRHLAVFAQGYASFDAAAFMALPLAIRVRILRTLVPGFGGGATPERAEFERLALDLETPGTRRTLGGAILWARKTVIVVAREAGRIAEQAVTVPLEGTILWDQRFLVTAPPGTCVFPARLLPRLIRVEGVPHPARLAEPAVQREGRGAELAGYDPLLPVHARFRPIRVL